jgi:hypothetical protein
MPESPDFDQIARQLVEAHSAAAQNERDIALDIAEQLRLVWNARGAADITLIEAELPGAYTKILDRALRTLDR